MLRSYHGFRGIHEADAREQPVITRACCDSVGAFQQGEIRP
jgi:hypothetical protein